MDAEQRRAEEGAGIIDSIAFDAVSAGAIPASDLAAKPNSGSNDASRVALELVTLGCKPIDQYCDDHRFEVLDRLKLFIQVCGAVHSVHQHAIIHRNLNPGNVLITSAGVPKLINFGDVKLVHGGSGNDVDKEGTVSLTRAGAPVLLLEYISPEQVMGDTVTTASDIYALGVILYELMTGRRPYHLKTGSESEVLQAICEQVPVKPSTVILGDSLERRNRTPTDDVDSIILTAMSKEPESRYASAQHFADDLRRCLNGSPVYAHQGSATYRAIKFMRRHAVAVIISGVLVLALVAGAVGIVIRLMTERRERNRAEQSSRQAREAVNQFFTRVSAERLLNQSGLHPLRKALLQDTQQFYEDFLSRHGGDRSLQAELASARSHVARISSVTGSTTDAIKQFEQAVRLWDDLVAKDPTNLVYHERLAQTLNEQGLLVMPLEGRRDEALRIFRRAQTLIEPLVANSHSVTAEQQLSGILLSIAEIEREQGQPEEAVESIQRSLAIESKLAANDPGALDSLISMAKGHALLGQIFATQPEAAELARTEYQQAIELLAKVNHEYPELSDQAVELALFLGDLSTLERMAGKLDSALASVRKAVEISEQLEQKYPGVLNYEACLGTTYNLISDVYRQRHEPNEAITFAQKAQTLLERLIALHPEDAYLRMDLAKSRNILGRLLQQTGEPVAALRSFQHAIDLYESMTDLDPRNCFNLACNVALSIPLIGVKNGSADSIDISKLSKGDRLRRTRYGDRAIELLRRAVEGGFVNLDILQSETDFDSIRDRPDFQSLIGEVEKKMVGRRN